MLQRCGFADADAKLADADYVVVGFHSTALHLFDPVRGMGRMPSVLPFNFEGYDYYYDLDINELTPAYDRGESALLAARLARELIAAKVK